MAISIDPLSVNSLFLELLVTNNPLSTATGFIVEHSNNYYLITNWHVLTGRDPESNQPLSETAGIPDEVSIIYHHKDKLGSWVKASEPLYDSGNNKLWLEHATGNLADVVALPLKNVPDVAIIYPFDVSLSETNVLTAPAMPVSIIGFPLGLTAHGAFPIWKTGHIASDPALDVNNQPYFLIDATTRGGMSGSPVVLRSFGGHNTKEGNYNMVPGVTNLFVGIYSGRLHEDSEIGRVWRPSLINEILEKT